MYWVQEVQYELKALQTTSVGFKDLWLKDLRLKDNDFPRGQQHWVTVKNGLLADIYQ